MKTKRFKVGQKVYCIDDEYGRINGEIVDTSSVSIFIKWEDMKQVVEQPISQTSDVRVLNKLKNK